MASFPGSTYMLGKAWEQGYLDQNSLNFLTLLEEKNIGGWVAVEIIVAIKYKHKQVLLFL